jgi:IS30 family transposase
MDCVVSGKGKGKAALLVLTERKSRKELILDRLEREYGTYRSV